MDWKRNYHTHTDFCDGQNTPEEMAEAAAKKGFTALGFSGHSYTDFDAGDFSGVLPAGAGPSGKI